MLRKSSGAIVDPNLVARVLHSKIGETINLVSFLRDVYPNGVDVSNPSRIVLKPFGVIVAPHQYYRVSTSSGMGATVLNEDFRESDHKKYLQKGWIW